LSLRSNPGLKLANAFGVFPANFKLRHYPFLTPCKPQETVFQFMPDKNFINDDGIARVSYRFQ